MPTTVTTSATARAVLALAEPFGLAVEGSDLIFVAGLPADLESAVAVLHTGVRALLTGRRWYGCHGETGRVVELDPIVTHRFPFAEYAQAMRLMDDRRGIVAKIVLEHE